LAFFFKFSQFLKFNEIVCISSTYLAISNLFLAINNNSIIELLQIIFQLLISLLTLALAAIKFYNELKSKNEKGRNK